MIITTRTPQGPNPCPECRQLVHGIPAQPFGETPCDHCGHILWFPRFPVNLVRFTHWKEIESREFSKATEELEQVHWLLDFKNTQYFSSCALLAMLKLLEKTKAANGQLVLCNMNENVNEVFEVTRLTESFCILSSETEALSHISACSV